MRDPARCTVIWVTFTALLGSLSDARALCQTVADQTVTSNVSEADMQDTITNRRHGTRDSVASAFLLVAGILVMLASADALVVLIAAVLIASLVWGLIREIRHGLRNRAALASVTHLHVIRHDAKTTPPQLLRHGRTAA
jgi:divalent metal cation (Fe/Co/Zn/Cd) transporter